MKFKQLALPLMLSLASSSFSSLYAKEAKIEIKGRQVLVENVAFVMNAVCYNPIRKGGRHPDGLLFKNPDAESLEAIDNDFRLMREAGINTIRTYEAILDPKVLALVEKHELYMIVPAFNWFDSSLRQVVNVVDTLKSNPRVLFWEIGNEWNYNAFYSSPRMKDETSKQVLHAAVSVIKTIDKTHPVSSVFGEIPSKELLAEFPDVDVWGINIYSGLTFGKRFDAWRALSPKPMYLGEFGADAFNSLIKAPDEASQALAVSSLVKELQANLSANDPTKVAIGGAVFEWNDEWWKDDKGSADTQDNGGVAPGGGPFPDATFNEEWWGMVDMDRNVRPAYLEIKALWGKTPDPSVKPDAVQKPAVVVKPAAPTPTPVIPPVVAPTPAVAPPTN